MEAGLQFKRVDLHTHTPASRCFADKDITPREFVQAAIDAKLSALAITDHNTAAWVDSVKEAAQNESLTVFPGVEISAFGGIHVVGIFDVNKCASDIEHLLSKLDISPEQRGRSNTLCHMSANDVIEVIVAAGGLAILPHIDGTKGAFNTLQGKQDCHKLFNEAPYHAVEATNGMLPMGYDKSRSFKRFPCCIEASDNPCPTDPTKHSLNGLGSHCSYFKLGNTIDLEGIRQCFADPEVRIRGNDFHETQGFPRVLQMNVSDGFLKDQLVKFHKGLNSIIGGKGVGKSLIIEFIRFALNQESPDKEIVKDHSTKLEKRLGNTGVIEVKIQTASGTEYSIQRSPGSDPICTDTSTGKPYTGELSDLFPILAYSQTEVIGIAGSEDAQLKLIDSFVDMRPHSSTINDIEDKLKKTDQALADSISADNELQIHRKEQSTIEGQIKEIEIQLEANTDDASLLETYKNLNAKHTMLLSYKEYMQSLINAAVAFRDNLSKSQPPAIPESLKSDGDLIWAHDQTAKALGEYLGKLVKFETDLDIHTKMVDERIALFKPILDAKETEYRRANERIKGAKELAFKHDGLLKEQNGLMKKIDQCLIRVKDKSSIELERSLLLDSLDEAYTTRYSARKTIFDDLTAKSQGRLRLELAHCANRNTFEGWLDKQLTGTGLRKVDYKAVADAITPREFVTLTLTRDVEGIRQKSGITINSATKMMDKLHSFESVMPILEMEHECYPDDTPSVSYKEDGGDYAPLQECSVGQKCTALVIIALSEGTRPVIIDQPEDALDITTVWEDVSRTLRKHKDERQFILTTHNASVAVSSDSDMFIVVRANAKRGNVKCLGAIENSDVKKHVVQLLEGGTDPYKLRKDKYNLSFSN